MAQGVTPSSDPPGWRVEESLIDWLHELERQVGAVRQTDLTGVNDVLFGERVEALLTASSHLLTANRPDPGETIAEELEELQKAAARLRIPIKDPALDERTESLDKLRAALGLLRNAIDSAHIAATEARPDAGTIRSQLASIDHAYVNAMLVRLDH